MTLTNGDVRDASDRRRRCQTEPEPAWDGCPLVPAGALLVAADTVQGFEEMLTKTCALCAFLVVQVVSQQRGHRRA